MTRIEWLLKGDQLFSLQVARRTEPVIAEVIDDEEVFVPAIVSEEVERIYIGPGGPGTPHWRKGQRAVMP
jgi:hypothetical protein